MKVKRRITFILLALLTQALIACADTNTGEANTRNSTATLSSTPQINISVVPLTNTVTNRVETTALPPTLPTIIPTLTAAKSVPLPVVADVLSSPPQDCPSGPIPKQVADYFGLVSGGSPLWGSIDKTMSFSSMKTQYGYLQKVLWVMEPANSTPVFLKGGSLADGTPLWFKLGSNPPTSLAILLPESPGIPVQHGNWKEWPSYLYIPKSGYYFLQGDWNGGSWKINFAGGS